MNRIIPNTNGAKITSRRKYGHIGYYMGGNYYCNLTEVCQTLEYIFGLEYIEAETPMKRLNRIIKILENK